MKKFKNMKYLLSFGLMLMAFSMLAQQRSGIQWSEEYNARGYFQILSATDGIILAERKSGEWQDNRRVDIEFSRYDENLKLTNIIEVDELEDVPYTSIATIPYPGGLAHIYHMLTKNGEQIVSAQLYSKDNLNMLDILDLAKLKAKAFLETRIRANEDFTFEFPVDIVLSEDKTKLCIYYIQEKVGRRKATNIQYIVLDVANNFSYMYEGEVETDKESKHYALENMHLSDQGMMLFLMKNYKEDRDTEHINKYPGYGYEMHCETGDSTAFIYDIKLRKYYIDDLQITTDNDDNIFISGLERKQPYGDGINTYLLAMDENGNTLYDNIEPYTKREIEDIQGKEDDNIDDDFRTIKIFPTDDIIYIVRQYRRQTSQIDNFNNSFNTFGGGIGGRSRVENEWNYEDIIIEGIGRASGERQWLTMNPRRMRDNDEFRRYFITGDMEIIDNNLIFLYNERPENIEKIRKRDGLKRTDIPGDRTAFTVVKITSDGRISYDQLGEAEKWHIPVGGAFLEDEMIYLLKHERNYRDYKVGKISTHKIIK